jgi:hypothetical protein
MSEPYGDSDATTNSLVVARSTINGYSNANRQLGSAILAMGNRCPEERFKPVATPPDPMNFSVAVAAEPVLIGQSFRLSSLEDKWRISVLARADAWWWGIVSLVTIGQAEEERLSQSINPGR